MRTKHEAGDTDAGCPDLKEQRAPRAKVYHLFGEAKSVFQPCRMEGGAAVEQRRGKLRHLHADYQDILRRLAEARIPVRHYSRSERFIGQQYKEDDALGERELVATTRILAFGRLHKEPDAYNKGRQMEECGAHFDSPLLRSTPRPTPSPCVPSAPSLPPILSDDGRTAGSLTPSSGGSAAISVRLSPSVSPSTLELEERVRVGSQEPSLTSQVNSYRRYIREYSRRVLWVTVIHG